MASPAGTGTHAHAQAALRQVIPLDGPWELRPPGAGAWAPATVPGCWELDGLPKDLAGPVAYRTRLEAPTELAGRRLWLRFGAVSYHAEVAVDGQPVGEHTGAWDPFELEVTGLVTPGGFAELTLLVEKPASLTNGPDSAPVPGRFPLRETLAGFLPYVWGHLFGGPWQGVTLEATGPLVLGDAHVRGSPDGRVRVEAELPDGGRLRVEVLDPAGVPVGSAVAAGQGEVALDLHLPDPRPWSPWDPALYTARLTLDADGEPSDARELRFGLRSVVADGTAILLNGEPLYSRMVLSWGWYPNTLHPNPGREVARAELERLRALGYNGVKLCLWVPPEHYLDLADELGLLVWLELPMWLPRATPFFRAQTPPEYERLLRLARNHPAVVLYTLGCELDREIGADLLGPLYARAKALVGDALVRDNSGSGEAYGGLLDEFAEFYDYHFYAELPYFDPLVDHFAARWRSRQPWLFGEFCDSDAFRDLGRLEPRPWWASDDPAVNPQGARWQHDLPFQDARLRETGLAARGGELERISARQSLLHRKRTLEATRLRPDVTGYVVTGEKDTPISTAGMWDDLGRARFDGGEFRAFNEDLVVLAGWDRRRAWVAGGDRAAYWDPHCHRAGETVRPHAVVSNYSREAGIPRVRWSVGVPGAAPLAAGELEGRAPVAPGNIAEVGVAAFRVPVVDRPRRLTLRVEASVGAATAANAWPLWVFPPDAWAGLEGVALIDPGERLPGLRGLAPHLAAGLPGARVVVATAWSPELAAFVRAGGRAVLAHDGGGPAGPVPTAPVPYWREAIKILEPHRAWGDFPHEGWADLQFYGMAPDRALDASALEAPWSPILRRLDARTMAVHEYALELELGGGRLLVTTLAFGGGHGDQPAGIERNPAASHLLAGFARHLLDA